VGLRDLERHGDGGKKWSLLSFSDSVLLQYVRGADQVRVSTRVLYDDT
jgi:hypothetical protein